MFRSPLLIGLLLLALILTGCANDTSAPQAGATATAVPETPRG